MLKSISSSFSLFVVFFLSKSAIAQTIAPENFQLQTGVASIDPFLNIELLGTSVWRICIFTLLLIFGVIFKRYILHALIKKTEVALQKTTTEWDNELLIAIERPLGFVFLTIALWFSILFLRLPDTTFSYVSLGLGTIGTIFAAWVILRAIDILDQMLLTFALKTESQMDDHLVPLVKRILRVVVVIVTILTILQQWGYQVSSIIAGLGIGGLAFALAAQDTLGNWFGSLMIFTDRPFVVGDIVKFNDQEGTVEEVGLRSTRVRTFEKTIVTVPNKSLAATAIENLTSRSMRRIRLQLGLEYETSSTQMRTILEKIKIRLEEDEMVHNDSIVVAFTGLGESTLDVLVNLFIKTLDYDIYLSVKQALLLDIMQIVEEAGSGFAFPSRTIYNHS